MSFLNATILNRLSNSYLQTDLFVVDVVHQGQISLIPLGRLMITILSVFFCEFLYLFSGTVFPVLSSSYNSRLSQKERMFWNLAFMRGVYGSLGCVCSIYEIGYKQELWADVVLEKSVSTYFQLLAHLGFFVFEWLALCYFDLRFNTFSSMLHLHHLFAILGFGVVAYNDYGHFMPLIGFIEEMTTPFSCICFCLIKCNMSRTKLWAVNQGILVHLFHLRSVLEFIVLSVYLVNFSRYFQYSLLWNFQLFLFCTMLMLLLTPYWTFKKTEQYFTHEELNSVKLKGVKLVPIVEGEELKQSKSQ